MAIFVIPNVLMEDEIIDFWERLKSEISENANLDFTLLFSIASRYRFTCQGMYSKFSMPNLTESFSNVEHS